MRKVRLLTVVVVAAASGCGEVSIGQPCTFGWPRNSQGSIDCSDYPACAPLQDTARMPPRVANDACPIDCIQMPTLQCENLICVSTQIFGDTQHINGRCHTDLKQGTECPDAPMGCQGYCTKECLSDASCPKGYSCSHMAPFGENLRCDDETQWGTECTDTCQDAGSTPSADVTCPASGDYTKCDYRGYSVCCTCMCYRYCPLLQKKFCRKSEWDQTMFPDSTSSADCT